jgi:hypothetical protein
MSLSQWQWTDKCFFSAPSRFHWVNPPSRVPSLNQFLNSSGKEKELLIFKHS